MADDTHAPDANTRAETEPDDDADVILTVVTHVLADEFRRNTIRAIGTIHDGRANIEGDTPIHCNTIADHLDTGSSEYFDDVGTTLSHVTLPQLDDWRLLDYDTETRTVEGYDAEKLCLIRNALKILESVVETHEFAKEMAPVDE